MPSTMLENHDRALFIGLADWSLIVAAPYETSVCDGRCRANQPTTTRTARNARFVGFLRSFEQSFGCGRDERQDLFGEFWSTY